MAKNEVPTESTCISLNWGSIMTFPHAIIEIKKICFQIRNFHIISNLDIYTTIANFANLVSI